MLELKKKRIVTNKIVASSLLVAGMVGAMILSWYASPDSFGGLIGRSIPLMVMIFVLIFVTIMGANVVSRLLATFFFITFGIIYMTVILTPEWGVAYLFIGFTMACDLGISANGCKSPMETNANDNFLVVVAIFGVGSLIGYLFELLNSLVLGWWILAPIISYPMVEVNGINLIVIFTYAFIGFLLFELATFIFTMVKRLMNGKEKACEF